MPCHGLADGAYLLVEHKFNDNRGSSSTVCVDLLLLVLSRACAYVRGNTVQAYGVSPSTRSHNWRWL